jgi:hypothetical protein
MNKKVSGQALSALIEVNRMDFATLRTLIETHPTHAATSDEDMVLWVDDEVVVRDRATMPANDIMDTILSNTVEWTAMTADEKQIMDMILSHSDPVPVAVGDRTRTVMVAILGTNTKADLAAKIPETVSRAVDVGITQTIAAGHIAHARTF